MRTIRFIVHTLFIATTIVTHRSLLSQAQDIIGVDVCSCSPNSYEFTFDFGLLCPPVNITLGDAVSATSCLISPIVDPNIVDLIPVSVQSIEVLELNQDFQVLFQQVMDGNFVNGDTFIYSSIADTTQSEITDVSSLPRSIQIRFNAMNVLNQPLLSVFVITFTNRCDIYPVLFEGQSAGWVRFTMLGVPKQELCPLAPSTPGGPVITSAPAAATPTPSPSPTATPSFASIGTSPQPTMLDNNIMSMSMGYALTENWMRMLVEENNFETDFVEFGRRKNKIRKRRRN